MDDIIRDIYESISGIQTLVIETQDEFIFQTISKFVGTITEMEISKEELIRAISLIRLQREASERYGSMISNDWDTATRQMHELTSAYKHGFADGMKEMNDRLKDMLEEDE